MRSAVDDAGQVMTASPKQPRIVLVHATPVAMVPIRTAMARQWPEAEAVDLLDEALSIDRAKASDLTPDLTRRILGLADYAVGIGADGVLFTCAAFGPAINAAAAVCDRPVLKPNEAMFEAARAHGPNIAMLYTFPPARQGLEAEFREQVQRCGGDGRLAALYVADAMAAVRNGDTATHDRLIAEAASKLKGYDAVMLAQFSMSRAADAAQAVCPAPVLSSPDAAVAEMKRRIGLRERGPC